MQTGPVITEHKTKDQTDSRSEILTVVNMKIMVIWDVKLCSMVGRHL
jgi:hypothetical protein